jgi:hypothetical protein
MSKITTTVRIHRTKDDEPFVAPDQLLRRIRAEYLEMPGLRLTPPQAKRLWGLDEYTCAQVLDSLAEAKFLRRTDDGAYARLFDGAFRVSETGIEQR